MNRPVETFEDIHGGQIVAQGTAAELQADESVRKAYLGI